MHSIAYHERYVKHSMRKSQTPLPGRPVRGSGTGRPIMALFDLLGRRATLRVLWELSLADHTFRTLTAAAMTNPSVLNARLRELRDAEFVEHDAHMGYRLTSRGRALLRALGPLTAYAETWKPQN